MFKKELTCIVCPRGCSLTVMKKKNEYEVSGNFCKRGIDYGIKEVTAPVRYLTSTVRISGAMYKRLPVITDKEIPKEKIPQVMKELNKVNIKPPIKYKDVIIKNVMNTDANIIASRSME